MKKEFRFTSRGKALIAMVLAFAAINILRGQLPAGIKREKDIKQALCHTWNLNYKVGFTTGLEEPTESLPTIDFLDNGSLIINTTSPKITSWSYDKKSHLLILDLKGHAESYKILKLTNEELLLQTISNTEQQIRYWWND